MASTSAPAADRPRLDSLTGLRFAAALLVFGTHASGLLNGTFLRPIVRYALLGSVGVSFFFMLSGFVLMWTLRSHDRPSAFWRRRAARILPAYWVAWCLGLLVTLGNGEPLTPGRVVLSFTLLQSWRPQAATYFAVNGVSWSLSCEVLFYAVSPWLLPALARLSTAARRRALAIAVALSIGVPLVLVVFVHHGPTVTWAARVLPPARLPEFVLGALLALELADGRWRRVPLGAAGAVTAGAFIAVGALDLRVADPFLAVPFALLIAAAAHRDIGGRPTTFSTAKWVTLGVWSYSFYLIHEIVLRELNHLVAAHASEPALLLRWVASLLVATAAAALLYRLVEHPLERRLRHGPARVNEMPSVV